MLFRRPLFASLAEAMTEEMEFIFCFRFVAAMGVLCCVTSHMSIPFIGKKKSRHPCEAAGKEWLSATQETTGNVVRAWR